MSGLAPTKSTWLYWYFQSFLKLCNLIPEILRRCFSFTTSNRNISFCNHYQIRKSNNSRPWRFDLLFLQTCFLCMSESAWTEDHKKHLLRSRTIHMITNDLTKCNQNFNDCLVTSKNISLQFENLCNKIEIFVAASDWILASQKHKFTKRRLFFRIVHKKLPNS